MVHNLINAGYNHNMVTMGLMPDTNNDIYSQPRILDGLVLVAGEAHGEGVPRPPRHRLHVVSVLHAAGEGRHPALAGLHRAIGLGVLVNEDEPPTREVSLVVGEIQQTGEVE